VGQPGPEIETVDVAVVRHTMRFAVCAYQALAVAAFTAGPLVASSVRAEPPVAVAADEEAFGGLLAALRSGDSFRVRATAAVALGRGGDPRAVPALEEALRGDNSYAVRAAACAALGRIGNPAALPALVTALGDTDEYVRTAAEEALERFHTPALLFSFRELLQSPDERARRAAVLAYGAVMRAPDASPGLATFVVQALDDDDEAVVLAAEAGLAALPHERALPVLLDGLRAGDSGIKAGCARQLEKRIDLRAVEPLIGLILDTDSTADVRTAARQALRRHAEYLDLAGFAAAAGSAEQPVRIRALRVLAAVGDPRAGAVVDRALGDADPAVRVAGARAAADLGGPRARTALESALARESDPRQKRQLELLLKSMPR
jgi:HEAT repeat protein